MKFALQMSLEVTKGVESEGTRLELQRFLNNLFVEMPARFKVFLVVTFCWQVDVANLTSPGTDVSFLGFVRSFCIFLTLMDDSWDGDGLADM